ncbi:MAG TPA: DNA polymerase III subunit beta [Candidatus Saccharimonadales bacterium]|nr:DNA polymerase III subunit beta [Candidatus Saccharimonadales bacterium]
MKFKIPQGEFTKLLIFANKSLLAKANLPILANILISATKGRLEVVSTNLETATKVACECDVEIEGKVAIPGKLLLEFVSQLPDADLVFEKLGEEAVVSTKRYSGRFATQPVEDFPAIPKIDKGTSIMVAGALLMKAIGRVAFCAAMDEGRPILTGVLCELLKNSLSFVATDGYRLSYQKILVERAGEGGVKIVVPSKSIMEVGKIISELGEELGEGKVEILVGDSLNQVNFKIGRVEYTSRLIEGTFPNWQKLIPASFTSKAKVSKEEFIKIVRVASIFARDAGNIVKFKLESAGKAGGLITSSAVNAQVGSNEASCEVELNGAGGEIAFNFRYLLEMLSSVDSEEVEFEMIESLNPGRLTVPGDNDYFHIVMPVRLQS